MKKILNVVLVLFCISCSNFNNDIDFIEANSFDELIEVADNNSIASLSSIDSDSIDQNLFNTLSSNEKILFLASLRVASTENLLDINPGFYPGGLNLLSIDFHYLNNLNPNTPGDDDTAPPDEEISGVYMSHLYAISNMNSTPNYNLYEAFNPTSGFTTANELINVVKNNFDLNFGPYDLNEVYFYVTKHQDQYGDFSHFSLKQGLSTYVELESPSLDDYAADIARLKELQKQKDDVVRECANKYLQYQTITGLPMSVIKITPCWIINNTVGNLY
ncbi:hypothetical protein FAZ19_13150 [Sphingobacterium alkalisoli]|uniref:Uncharacterized protein n=1 Tax=Sphingobacterium alkalisoli TaxID=1874115 RepID=A0A4U0H4C2_9SPHI|nr:hypothetical protein [Sphingobacterium alkalisoli]TJY66034.1 hypothetical protein FAZ19_13150 [Sphingobacterium alkalisoli]GGH16662.1 hypothetical protein GCM10011418_19170 [Sphingobacterium alkalisoli]